MGIMDRIKNATGAGYDDGYEDDYYGNFDNYDNDNMDDGMMNNDSMGGMSGSNIGNMGSAGPVGGMGMGGISLSGTGSALEMKVVKPTQFDNVSQIADHLLNKRTIVLNLENTSKETARRLIDFLSGVAYSIDGSMKKIAANAYVITPNNVDVGDAQLKSPRKDPEPEPAHNPDVFPEF